MDPYQVLDAVPDDFIDLCCTTQQSLATCNYLNVQFLLIKIKIYFFCFSGHISNAEQPCGQWLLHWRVQIQNMHHHRNFHCASLCIDSFPLNPCIGLLKHLSVRMHWTACNRKPRFEITVKIYNNFIYLLNNNFKINNKFISTWKPEEGCFQAQPNQ